MYILVLTWYHWGWRWKTTTAGVSIHLPGLQTSTVETTRRKCFANCAPLSGSQVWMRCSSDLGWLPKKPRRDNRLGSSPPKMDQDPQKTWFNMGNSNIFGRFWNYLRDGMGSIRWVTHQVGQDIVQRKWWWMCENTTFGQNRGVYKIYREYGGNWTNSSICSLLVIRHVLEKNACGHYQKNLGQPIPTQNGYLQIKWRWTVGQQ